MIDDPRNPSTGTVRGQGRWAVGTSDGRDFAVSRVCRHQLADLGRGHIDAEGCLVCPWHQSRYDVRTGAMIEGPRGLLWWHGPTPGYTQLFRMIGQVLRLRVGRVERDSNGVRIT